MSMTDVAWLLAELRAGRVSIDDVAERFRQRDWPATRHQAPATYVEMAAQHDVAVDVPGSLDEITAAYDRGELTSDQYRVLSDAVADAINAEPLPEARHQEQV